MRERHRRVHPGLPRYIYPTRYGSYIVNLSDEYFGTHPDLETAKSVLAAALRGDIEPYRVYNYSRCARSKAWRAEQRRKRGPLEEKSRGYGRYPQYITISGGRALKHNTHAKHTYCVRFYVNRLDRRVVFTGPTVESCIYWLNDNFGPSVERYKWLNEHCGHSDERNIWLEQNINTPPNWGWERRLWLERQKTPEPTPEQIADSFLALD